MINYYLDTITVGYFNENDLPPDNVRDYEFLVEEMKLKAVRNGDLKYLKLAIAWLLANEAVDPTSFNGGRYPFDADEMREILSFVYQSLMADGEQPSSICIAPVELTNLTLE